MKVVFTLFAVCLVVEAASAAVTLSSSSSLTSSLSSALKNKVALAKDMAVEMMKIGNTMTQLVASLKNESISKGVEVGKGAVTANADVAITSLYGGSALLYEGLDILNSIADSLPSVIGEPMRNANTIAAAGVESGTNLGVSAVNAMKDMKTGEMDLVSDVASQGAQTAITISNSNTDLGETVVGSVASAVDLGIDTKAELADSAISALETFGEAVASVISDSTTDLTATYSTSTDSSNSTTTDS